jgi:hypothetical protein
VLNKYCRNNSSSIGEGWKSVVVTVVTKRLVKKYGWKLEDEEVGKE